MNDAKPTKNGVGIASLVLGIIAIICSYVPIIHLLSGVLAIIGIILGIVGIVQISKVHGTKTFSAVAIILNIIALIVVISTGAAYQKALNTINEGAQPASKEVPTLNLKVGESAKLDNGLVLTLDSVERSVSVKNHEEKFTAATVTIKNEGNEKQSFNPIDWRSVSSEGVESGAELVITDENKLESGDLQPGGKVTGVLYFKNDAVKISYVSGFKSTTAASWDL